MILFLGTTPTLQRSMTFARMTADAVNRARRTRHYASGKSINAARVAHTLGQTVLTTGFIGGDVGRLMLADLGSAGIPHDFVQVPISTRICTTVIDQTARTATELVEEPQPVDAALYGDLIQRVNRRLTAANVLVISGSLPPGADPFFYGACLQLADARQVATVLDIRGRELLAALPNQPKIVKPNRSELAQTFDVDLKNESAVLLAMQELIKRGARQVLVSDGPHPALCTDGTSAWRLRPPSITPVSPIGSGDAMAAGLAIAIEQDMDLASAAALAVACGAANALTPDAGHVTQADVERLRKQIVVEAI